MPHGRQLPASRGKREQALQAADARRTEAAVLAGAIVAVQGVGLIVAGVYLIVRSLQGGSQHAGSTAALGVLSLLAGAGVLAMARGVRNRRRRVRGPLLTLEIICLPIAITAIQGGRWYVGVPLGLVAIAVVVLLGFAGILGPEDDADR